MNRFYYILEKITNTTFTETPFKHPYIEDIFSDDYFREIVNSPEVNIPPVETDTELIVELYKSNFEAIGFGVTTTDSQKYITGIKIQ